MEVEVSSDGKNGGSEGLRRERRSADEKLCRAMVNSIMEYAVILTDPDGFILSLNKGAELILGYKEHEVVGKKIAIFYPPETLPTDGPEMNLQEALVNNNYQVKGWRLKKNGGKFLANIHYTALYDESHDLLGYMKVIYEITEGEVANGKPETKRRTAESNLSFRKLIENSYSGITLLDKEFKVIYRSQSAERITGWKTGERIKVTREQVIHPDDAAMVAEVLAEVLSSPGVPKHCTFRSMAHEGYYIWLDCVYTNFLDEPNVNAIVCNFIDVTEKKRSDERLKVSEQRFRTLLENGADGITVIDLNRKPLYLSPGFSQVLGYNDDEFANLDPVEFIHPEDMEYTVSKFRECLINPGVPIKNVNYRVRHKSGHWVYIGATLTNLLNDPIIGGIVNNFTDITRQKQEEHHLKLLESVITNTSDSITITKADQTGASDPRILFVNEAFTKMTGYTAQDVIGRSPRILQGPKTDRTELKRMRQAMLNWQPCEISVINYKKNGEEFWINISISPVADDKGQFTHWVAIQRDITAQKNEDEQLALLSEISIIFNESLDLNVILFKALKKLAEYGNFSMAEAWLISTDRRKATLAVKYVTTAAIQTFYSESVSINSVVKGEGLPGLVWESGAIQFISDIADNEDFLRKNAAMKAGLTRAYGVPLHFKNEVIGVLIFGLTDEFKGDQVYTDLFNKFSRSFGEEIRRKQLEQELNQLFNSAPDVICTAGVDGYWKKVNPAMIKLLEYTELELLNRPLMEFIHPDDRAASIEQFQEITEGEAVTYFENRYITRSGKIKWLAWTTSAASREGLVYCVAKDITEKKEFSKMLDQANNLARIGGWEIDLARGSVYWSDITKEIHEVGPDFKPDLESGLSFYKAGDTREYITQRIKDAIEKGISWDVELQIVTAKGNEKWIRVIGEAELVKNKCIRIYGSFQDIDARKKAEISVTEILEDRNTILESIGDAFFAVDKNWTVTYWNNMAEKVLGKTKQEMLNRNLWDIFNDSLESDSYKRYHEALASNRAIHFEDYYPPLGKWYEISAYPSENGLSVYFKDVTQRKVSDTRLLELNESLQAQARELATSNAELEQFAYVASHDLQEPLRMVTGFLTQIEKKYNDKLDEKGRQYINFAVDGAKRMRQIILDLLEFSKVGSLEDSIEDIDLGKMVNEVTALYRKQIEEKKAAVQFEDLPVIRSFKAPLRQVFQNLISNGLKYNDKTAGAAIKIACKETKKYWQIAVSDNGVGIEPEYFDKIFIIFQRLHNKDEYSGTGMGLAIAKKIVENLGGKIWVESEKGKGSTFYFTVLKNRI